MLLCVPRIVICIPYTVNYVYGFHDSGLFTLISLTALFRTSFIYQIIFVRICMYAHNQQTPAYA